MKVSEMGEFGLIDLLAKMAYRARDQEQASWRQLIAGIGDDAAAWRGDRATQLATVDSFIQDVHFTLGTASWADLGWKAIAANLSDMAAMGGQPRYALVSLALPDDTEVADVTALYRGMIKLAGQSGVALVGGDTSRAPLVVINITILGNTGGQDRPILTRSAARAGDKIAVTGRLGAAAAGMRLLSERLQISPRTAAALKKAFRRPCPRLAEGQLLVEQGIKTAIDISDGLVQDLGQICKASRVGARLEIDRVPVATGVKANFGDSALELALAGGEDYELLFTGSTEAIAGVENASACPITVIGEITADKTNKVTLVTRDGKPFKLDKRGWEHFAPK